MRRWLVLLFGLLGGACGGSESPKEAPPLYADVVVPPAPRPPPPASSDVGDESPLFAPGPEPSSAPSAASGSFFEITPSASTTAPPTSGTPVEAAIERLRPGFRQCYRDGLTSDPSLKGDMKVDITVRKDGSIGSMSVLANDLPGGVEACLVTVIKTGRYDGVAKNNDTHLVIPIHLAK